MPLTAQLLKDRLQARVSPGDETEFYRLLTEADERLLNMGRWGWTRTTLTLVPDAGRLVTLPVEYESVVGCRLGAVASGVAWQEVEYMEGGPGLIAIEGCTGRLIDQGRSPLDPEDEESVTVRRYKVSDTDTISVSVLARYASITVDDASIEVLCPSIAALKQMMFSIIHEEADNTRLSMECQQRAKATLDEQESAYRGAAKQVFKPSMTIPLSRRSRTNFP